MGESVIGDVKYGALKNDMLNHVLRKFGSIAFKRCSVMMEFEHFLASRCTTGGCCLEIGTYHGISAVVLSQYFEHVVCVSVDDNAELLLKRRIVEYLGINNVQFFDVPNNREKARIVEALKFDFCYQDGNHIDDTHSDFALVQRCGRVLFHEYWPIQPAVWNLVNALPQHEVTRAQFDCLAYWERSGA